MTLAVDSGQPLTCHYKTPILIPSICVKTPAETGAHSLQSSGRPLAQSALYLYFWRFLVITFTCFCLTDQRRRRRLWSRHDLKKRKKVIADRNGSHHRAGLDSTTAPGEAPQAESAWSLKGELRQIIPFRKNGSDRIRELESGMI